MHLTEKEIKTLTKLKAKLEQELVIKAYREMTNAIELQEKDSYLQVLNNIIKNNKQNDNNTTN